MLLSSLTLVQSKSFSICKRIVSRKSSYYLLSRTLVLAFPKRKYKSFSNVSNKPLLKLLWNMEALGWDSIFPKTWWKCMEAVFRYRVKSMLVLSSFSPFHLKKHPKNKFFNYKIRTLLINSHINSKISKFWFAMIMK